MKCLNAFSMTLLASIGSVAHAHEQPVSYYVSARVQNAHQNLAGQQMYSPRAVDITRAPANTNRLAGSLAVGTYLPGNWRIETEYVFPVNSTFETQWRFRNPTSGALGSSRNVVETRSQRLMLNGYKDFPLNSRLSLYGGLGIGLSHIDADGHQGVVSRRFERAGTYNLAWSITLGADVRLSQRLKLGAGYRYADLGKYKTGNNLFLNNASGRRDEQHRGRLAEQNLFVELRADF